MSIEALEEFCQREGKSLDAARKTVGRLVDGVSREEAAAIVLKLLQPQEAAPMSVEMALAGLKARHRAVDSAIDGLKEKDRELRAEKWLLDRGIRALRKVQPPERHSCDLCGFTSASKQGVLLHRRRTHERAA